MTQKQEPVKISALELENVKRVRAVALTPSAEGLTIIGGRNNQGKTSVLDGIAYALGGGKRRPSELQNHDGLKPARMEIRLSNGLVVLRDGKNADLKVTDPSGQRAGQKLLDSFVGEFSLDLPKFMALDSKKKGEVLLGLVPERERLEALDRDERKCYDERLIAGREAERKRHYAEKLEEFPDAPDAPLSAADISRQLTDALAENAKHKSMRDAIDRLRLAFDQAQMDYERAQERAAEAQRLLTEAARRMEEAKEAVAQGTKPIPPDIDLTALNFQLEEVEATNAKVRSNQAKALAIDEAKQAEEEYKSYSNRIEAIREERRSLLASIKFPLDGLSIDNGELTFNGQRWDCMSSSEQMRVATSICQALKPECGFVLLDKLEQFDPEELESFGKWLEEHGLQAIGTRVSRTGECSVIIEDGMVVGESNPTEPQIESVVIGGF